MEMFLNLFLKNKEDKTDKDTSSSIEISTLVNPLHAGSKYHNSSNKENLKLKNYKEKLKNQYEYTLKENIIYNTIPNDYIFNSNSDTTNTHYYQNYFELREDFDFVNYMNLINIRQNYLKVLFERNENKEITDEKKEENNEKEKKEEEKNNIEEELKTKDTLYSLILDLTDMMNYQQDQGDSFLYYSIFERIFSNIFFEFENFFDKNDLIRHALYESKLCECIDLFEKNFISKEENINNKIIHFLYQLQKISLSLKSCGAFLKILKLMKSKNIVFDNYNLIYDEYFKFSLTNLTKKRIKEDNSNNSNNNEVSSKEDIIKNSKMFEILLEQDISTYECCTDDKYLFLCYITNNNSCFKLAKYSLLTWNKILEKEIEKCSNISILYDYKNNKLDILIYKQENEFDLLIINKNDFSIEKKISIFSPIEKEEFTQMVTSLSFFYLISNEQIYSLDISNLNKTLVFNTFIVLKKRTKKDKKIDKSYYFILDNYINFSCSNKINIKEKTFDDHHEENKENERNYYDNYNNILYTLKMKGRKIIEINKNNFENFKLRMLYSENELNKIIKNIDNSLSVLAKDYPIKTSDNEDKEEKKVDFFKHYLDYSNNLESILNIDNNMSTNKENKYKISKELSENYYLFLYSSMIKYYHYFNEKNDTDKLIININSNAMFDIVKQMATEEKDYTLLYIYTIFITQESNKNINSKLEEKINWIVKFCLDQEKLYPYLFETLRELYKYNPKYISSTNIAQDLISSEKLSLEERICYFSLVSLKEKKNIFNKLLEKFLSIEKQIILSNEKNMHYSKFLYREVSENFINYFQDIKLYKFDEMNDWDKFKEILKIFANNYTIIINEINKIENKNNINMILLKNSVVCQVLFLLINIIIVTNDKIPENYIQSEFINILLKAMIVSGNYSEEKKIEHNIEKEESIIINLSEYLNDTDNIEFVLLDQPEKIFLDYDFESNYQYKMKLDKLPDFIGYPTDIEQKELGQGKNIKISNTIKIDEKDLKKEELIRFIIKLSNYKNDESNLNILINIRKSILFFILISSNIKEENETQDEKKELIKNKINNIIKSDFFKDISIIFKLKKDNNNIINDFEYFDFNLKDFYENKEIDISEEYKNKYIKQIDSIFDTEENKEKNMNIININPSISSIIGNLLKNESHKKLLELIDKEFINKNKWGIINESLLKSIIINLFGIIIYEFDLYDDFEELINLNNKNKLLNENKNLITFIKIYTKINELKKLVSKKKQDISILKKNEEEVFKDELLKEYITNINNKINFIIENKKPKENNDKDDSKENGEINLEKILKTISFLLNYASDDTILKPSIEKGLKDLNENIIQKEKVLNYLNKLLYISNNPQDIKDLICTMNSIIKNGKKILCDFNNDLQGADDTLVQKYKKQVYIYILQIINKIKENKNNNAYDISYYYTLVQSLYWNFTIKDYKFIEKSQFYDIFNFNNKNIFINLLLNHNSNYFNLLNIKNANIYRISYDSLYKESFYLFKFMTFTAVNEFNDINTDEKMPFIKYIFDFIINIFNKYINEMNDLKNKKKEIKEIINEEKMNSFLMLFYRCILKNNIPQKVKKYYNNILTLLFQILCDTSTKNKILTLKIIEILFINDTKIDEQGMKNDIESFKNELKMKNIKLYNYINSQKVKHIDNIFIEFLFNFALLLQQNIDNIIKYINGTENNMALSLIIIKIIQNKLVKNDNSFIYNQIMKFIELNYGTSKFLSIILQIIGVDINYIHINSYIEIGKEKKGIILGFTKNNDESVDNYRHINYNQGDYIYYLSEDNIYRDFLTNLNITFDILPVKNLKIMTYNIPILSLEKNKLIYENLIENITQYEPNNIYIILRYIKMLLIENTIKLNDKIISYIMTKSLNKDVLNFKCKIITLEKLEKLMIPYLFESNPSIFIENEDEKKNKIDEKNAKEVEEEPLFVDPTSPDIFLDDKSLWYRCGEDHMFGFNYHYSKIYNFSTFTTPKKTLKLFNNVSNAKRYKEKCILITKELSNIGELPPNVNYIIIPCSFKDENIIKNNFTNIPVIMIDDLEFKNITENCFYQNSFPEVENLFLISLQSDVTSLIEIPNEKIAYLVDNQRDTIIEMLGEEPNYESKNNEDDDSQKEEGQVNEPNYEEFKNILCGKSINKINKNIIFNKLISLICRRMIITVKMTQKIKIPIDDLEKLIKLLLYENLVENLKEIEIVQILKNFVIVTTLDDDIDTIKCFTNLDFLDGKNIYDDQKIKEIDTESELLSKENMNNNLFLIDWFFLTQYEFNKSNILGPQFSIDYISKLVNQDNDTITFLLKVFKHIEKNIKDYISVIEKNKNIFCSKEIISLFDSCEIILDNALKDGDNDESKFNTHLYEKIKLFLVYFNILYKLKLDYNMDLDINYYDNSLVLNIFKVISLLQYFNKKEKTDLNYINFVELFYQKGLYKYLLDYNQFSKPLQRIKLNYYDKSFNSNFVMNFQNLIPKNLENNINSISLILREVDNKLVNYDNCVFLYESEKCNNLQDYIKIFDRPNDKRILLLKDNFTISYPNKNFFTYLYGSGSNDKNSLGIQIGNKEKFSIPQSCVGLEECKNIVDFKFGYYHTFVQSSDGNLLTCGTDKGSSFRYEMEFPYFNKETYFYSLAKENEGIKVIAANNFNTSILLTNNNKLFCCGKNNANCLGNSIPGEGEVVIPVEMPEFLPVIKEIKPPYIVKEIACGYKSTLFLLEAGYAFTCGSQDFRQCGSKENVPYYREYFPLYPPRGTKFTHVVAGEEFFLLLVEEIYEKGYGKLYSLGQNEFGRSGAGELNYNYTLQRLEEVEDKDFTVISSRNENAAAITTEGDLYTFGNNASYALGFPKSKNYFVPKKVETLKNYICDNVGISQNHMIVIARRKESGKKVVLSCGDNQYKALCEETEKEKVKELTETKFFLESKPDEEPIKATLSRYQTYLMSIKVDLKTQINRMLNEFKCTKCNKVNQYYIYFGIDENKKFNYYCNKCVIENNKKIFYVLNTIDDDTKNNIELLLNNKDNINELCLSFEDNKNKSVCLYCKTDILNNVYQSYSNENIILCEKCYMSKCVLIEYPQLFMTYSFGITPKKGNKKINVDSILYPNIAKTDKPYLEFDVVANYKKEYIIKELYKNKELFKLYSNTWKLINNNILKEMCKLKEFYEYDKFKYIIEEKDENEKEEKKNIDKKEEKDEIEKNIKNIEDKKEGEKTEEEKNKENKDKDKDKDKEERKIEYKNYEYLANIAGKSNKYLIYEIIEKLIEKRDKTDIKNEDFQNLDLYKKNNILYNIAFELSNRINNQIFKILDLSVKFKFPTIFKEVIESSLELITSKERKSIFQTNINPLRTSISLDNNEITLSRIKANIFYEKNVIDNEGIYTVFSQLYRKTRNYPKKNYLSNKNHRLFSVKLQGEGASDFSGVYNEIISIISFELQSKYLELFIKTPNNKNEIGLNRDKYIPNPLAKKQLYKDMFYFIGNLMLHAISSGNVLNLNLHPIFYKKILKQDISFNEIETLDKLSFKFINSLEALKDENEFNKNYPDLFFTVHSSSDNTLIELIKDGKYKKVTYDKLKQYIKLYKEFLMNEIDEQVSMIRKGIFDILDEKISCLITPEDLEEYICGSPTLNIQLLREKTSYEYYESDSPTIINFWKALESFTNEEKSKYLKFVSGRSRLPDPRNININHKISMVRGRDPDKKMPTSSTCYFTLNLPDYSSYEILRDKLRYVINNCSAIDADFFPDDGGEVFNEE